MRTKILFILLLNAMNILAQNGTVKGTIRSVLNNSPIGSVSVSIKGSSKGAISDSLGHYCITNLHPGYYNLSFSYIGYQLKEIYDIQVTAARETEVDAALEEDSKTLSEVKVLSPRFKKTMESPVSMRTIGSTEVNRNPGGNRDISKVLQSLPGVASSVSYRNDLIVRGGSPSENRFYIDGVEIPTINHFATQGASGGPVGLINVDFIKSVDFYSGAFPADRGDALSSVNEFIQKDASSDKKHAIFSLGSSDLSIVLDGPISRKTTIMTSYRYSYLQELFRLLQLPFLPSYQDFQFKVKSKFDKRNELIIVGLGAIDRFNINLNVPNTEQNKFILANIPFNEQHNYTIGAVYKRYRLKGYSLVVLSHDYFKNIAKKNENNSPSEPVTLNYSSIQTENKLRFENVIRENDYRINFGVGIEEVQYATNTYNLLPYGSNVYNSKIGYFKYGLFGQVSKAYFDQKLALSLGIRSDANTYSVQMENPGKTASPRFSASYSFNNSLSLNFNTGVYYELPSNTVLGYKDSAGNFLNKAVKYISNKQLILGLEYNTLKSAKFTVEGFYKFYQNYPLVYILGDSISLANLGTNFIVVGNAAVVGYSEGRSYGVEFLVQQKLNNGFYGIAALTLFKSEFKDKEGMYVPSSWDSRYILSVTGGRIFNRNWEVGVKFRFTGGSPYTPYNVNMSSLKSVNSYYPQGVPDWTRLNSQWLRNFYQTDIRIDKKYYFSKLTLNIYADIQNLTNFQYEMQPSLAPDRDANGNLQNLPGDPSRFKTKFLKNFGGNITPTLGVIVEL